MDSQAPAAFSIGRNILPDDDRTTRLSAFDASQADDLEETLNRGWVALIGPLGLAAALAPSFWATPESARANVLAGLIASVALCVFWALCLCRTMRPVFPFARGRIVRRLSLYGVFFLAFFFGATLGAIPLLLFTSADGAHRLLILAGFIAALVNMLLLGPIPMVGLTYMAPLLLGGLLGMTPVWDRTTICLDAFLALTAGMVMILRWVAIDHRRRHVIDRLVSAEKDQTIESLLFDFAEHADDFLWHLDSSQRLRNVSTRLAEAARLPEAKLEGILVTKVIDAPRVIDVLASGKAFRHELVGLKTMGEPIWWRMSGKPLRDDNGMVVGYRGTGTDVTAARLKEIRTNHLATFDSLTDLANRVQFQEHAAVECAAAAKDGRWRALLYLDLDGFKGINDRFGHAAGDAVLKEVALRLRQCVPMTALIARLGGDEFAIWYPATTPTKAEFLSNTIIKSLSVPFEVQGTHVEMSTSIGIAFTPKHGVDPVGLLGRADLALYQAKADGKGLWRVFIDDYETSVFERRRLLDDLKLGVARQEFEVFYQPLVNLSRGRVSCFEALVRWRSPTRGLVLPGDFIPIAESSNLIVAIGQWVLFQACKEAARWPDDVALAVNVSPQQLRVSDFAQTVMLALHRSGLPPHRLELEVTEGVFLEKSEAAMESLRTLRAQGISIALDDFGTGYSSLSYLIDFPVDKIKIDRCFVHDCATRRENQAIIDAILAIAKKLAIRVTAEGVETADQVIALKTRRCDDIQGFLISKPRPAADVSHMIASIPAAFRDTVPMAFESSLALALAMKRTAI